MNDRRHIQILKAYKLLFSQDHNINIDLIKSLNMKKIKSAYRSKALETHPDRAKLLGVNEKVLAIKFNEISCAYKDLYEFISRSTIQPVVSVKSRPAYRPCYSADNNNKNRSESQFRYTGKTEKSSYNEGKKRSSHKHSEKGESKGYKWNKKQGITKNFRLLFGQYLFFSGYITFSALLDAIFWQRKQRDLYGKIALKWGIIKKSDILIILKGRKPMEKFGDCALRLGYINQFQHNAILFKQTKMQKQLGEYFIKKGIISRIELQRILQEYKKYLMKN